jgi:hypothetical protein
MTHEAEEGAEERAHLHKDISPAVIDTTPGPLNFDPQHFVFL